jgi:hypothetical protein
MIDGRPVRPSDSKTSHLRGARAQRSPTNRHFFEAIQSYKSDDALSARYCNEIAASFLSADGINRGAVAGNGGEMAEGKKQLKKTRNCGTAKSKAVRKPRRKLAEIAPVVVSEPVAEPSIPVDPSVDGEEMLRNSLNREVAAKAKKIAEALAGGASKGNASCGKLLLDLMRRGKQPVTARSKSMSRFIDTLESELECVKPDTNDAKQT